MGTVPMHQLLASALETINHQQQELRAVRAAMANQPPAPRVIELMSTLGINRNEAETFLGMDAGVTG
jgi:hypothetical protein